MNGQKKKFTVFVSSTFNDLKVERQAAVEAILKADHIPAGMELFKSGDASQLETIYGWIDDCDIYVLILGGRYGSIEPISKKSYTELEYEYALRKGKPCFSVVITEAALDRKVDEIGRDALEGDDPVALRRFRENVLTKVSEFFDDEKDIKLSIINKLADLTKRDDLVGWVRGDTVANIEVVSENMKLRKEIEGWKEKFGDISTNIEFPDLPSFTALTNVSLVRCAYGTNLNVVADVGATWGDLFSIFYDCLQWGSEGVYWIDVDGSREGIAQSLLSRANYAGVTDGVRISEEDYKDCIALFEEHGFLLPVGEYSQPFSDVGKKFARRARFSKSSSIRVTLRELVSTDNEIPF